MGRLIDCNDVYNAIQITTDNFGVLKGVVESNMLTMLSKIETVEAIPKDQYEARLKADMVVALDKIRAEIEKAVWEDVIDSFDGTDEVRIPRLDPDDVLEIIDKYKEKSEKL